MKTESIIKLTLETSKFANSDMHSANVFIEGLCINFTKIKMTDYNYDFKITASNEDWSLRSAEYLFDTDFNMPNQIRNLIDQIDEINEAHLRLRRNRKVTNQQA